MHIGFISNFVLQAANSLKQFKPRFNTEISDTLLILNYRVGKEL